MLLEPYVAPAVTESCAIGVLAQERAQNVMHQLSRQGDGEGRVHPPSVELKSEPLVGPAPRHDHPASQVTVPAHEHNLEASFCSGRATREAGEVSRDVDALGSRQ